MTDLIRDHRWRPPMTNGANSIPRARASYADRPCEYMNCRRPRSEHLWAVLGTLGGRPRR